MSVHESVARGCVRFVLIAVVCLSHSWDPENLRFSDKSQKAIDLLRVKCLKMRCMVISDGRYYETVKANFERADRTTVVRTTTCCRVSAYHLLRNYSDLVFN